MLSGIFFLEVPFCFGLMKVSFDCATATILGVLTDAARDDFEGRGPKKRKRPEFLQKSAWLECKTTTSFL